MTIEGHVARISNKASWTQDFEIVDDDTGDVVSLAAAAEIYVTFRTLDTNSELLPLTKTGSRVVLAGDNLSASFTYRVSELGTLDEGDYALGIRIKWTADTDETQVTLGTVSVLSGL